jgi:isoquinoline 1-oxidoreductase
MADDPKRQYIRDCEAARCDLADFRFTVTRREFGKLGTGLLCVVSTASAEVSRIHVADDGTVTVMTGKVDMGQGSRTVITQVVAEEMRVPASRVRVLMGDTALVPDDGGTWASMTVPFTIPVIRAAAAAMRDKSGASGESPAAPARPVNGLAIVSGGLKYASDLSRPGLRHGRIVRPPAYRAKLLSHTAPDGTTVVREGNLLGVVADHPDTAARVAAQVKARWETEPLPARDEMLARFRSDSIPPKPGEGGRYPALVTNGNLREGLAAAAQRHDAQYSVVNVAHVPLEPRAVIAEWKEDKLTVWSGTQAPFMVRRDLAAAFSVPESDIRVIGQEIGGGYGGKQRGECEIEAARLARGAGAPVKLAWTREDEFIAGYCRPAGIVEMTAGLDANGRMVAWHHRNYNSGAAGLKPPYAIPHYSCEFHRAESPIRQGSYRSLACVANTFAREGIVDELAGVIKSDPLEFRLRNIEDARLREALTRAAERFGWGKRHNGPGGLACNLEKDARLALFVELDPPKVRRMVFAFDVGTIVNPDGLRNQAQGGLVQGLGGALFEELKWDARNLTNGRLSQYRVPRFSDLPDIDVLLIDRREIPSAGAGEAPITVVAPAIAAAMRARDDRPRRSLPLA